MKKGKKIILAVLLCFCAFVFVGCSNPFASLFSSSSTPKIDDYLTLEKTEVGETEGEEPETEEPTTPGTSNPTTSNMTELAETALKSAVTVFIKAKVVDKNNNNEESEGYALGSGMIVETNEKGAFIITNHHVIDSFYTTKPETENGKTVTWENQVYITIDGGATENKATIVWDSKELDMAILVCEDEEIKKLPTVKMKDRTIYCNEEDYIKILEPVVAIGSPLSFGLYNTVTEGTISSINLRNSSIVDEKEKTFDVYECLIQHMAPINPGNSGGALLDMNGNIIGLNTLALSSLNTISFSISIYPAIAVLDKVVENWNSKEETKLLDLGFEYHDALIDALCEELELEYISFDDTGVCVSKVESNCLIEGLEFGDVIKGISITHGDNSITEFEVYNQHSFIYGQINLLYAKSAKVKVLRDDVELELTINLGTNEA